MLACGQTNLMGTRQFALLKIKLLYLFSSKQETRERLGSKDAFLALWDSSIPKLKARAK